MSENKNNSHGIITTAVIAAVVLILLNVCTFAIPFHKTDLAVHFTAYGCAEFVLLAEMSLIMVQLFGDDSANQKIISLPIVFFGYLTLAVQILATVVFYIANAFFSLPIWIVIIVECLIIGLGAVQIAKGFYFKSANAEYHRHKANTEFMDGFRAKLKAISLTNRNKNIEKPLNDLVDIARGSDPVTNDMTIDSEKKLQSMLLELDEAVKSGSENRCREAIEKTKDTLIERNTLCKAGK